MEKGDNIIKPVALGFGPVIRRVDAIADGIVAIVRNALNYNTCGK
jgi:hypothetical protein